MINIEVKDMTCGHCVSTITKALKAIDPGAKIQIDLAAQRVQIEAIEAGEAELRDAIREAGYTPVAVLDAAMPAPVCAGKGCCR